MDVDRALQHLAVETNPPLDLAELALWLARDEYPSLDVDAYLAELAGMAHEAKSYVRGSLEQQVTGLCRYLFHEMGFRGNTQEYYDPRNSYLNEVLERRTGIPIALSMVALAVGRRAGMPLFGVGLPGHFVVKAAGNGEEIFFDPFHGGRRLNLDDCQVLVHQATGLSVELREAALRAVSLRQIVIRTLTNLKLVYLESQDFARAQRVIQRLRQIAPRDAEQQRDLGIVLFHNGQMGRAIQYLWAYLRAVPNGTDQEQVRQLLQKAYGEVGRWN